MARDAPFVLRNRRRAAILAGRLRHALGPAFSPAPRVVFLHMPKSGGTSLAEALQATVPITERIGAIDAVATRRACAMLAGAGDAAHAGHEDLGQGAAVFALREAMMLQHMAWDSALIHGHLPWSETAWRHFGDRYAFVTLLREPVARTLSNWRMARRAGLVPEAAADWLAGDVARRQARAFTRYLTGRAEIAEAELPQAVALARARLDRFALVGLLERPEAFLRGYRARFGVRPRLLRLNAAPEPPPALSPEEAARLRALCAPDIAIYDHARRIAAGTG